MRLVLILAPCVLLIGSPAMGKFDLMVAAREAATAVLLSPPEDPMYLAGQEAARGFALQHGLVDIWTEGIEPPAELLIGIAEENRYRWSQGWTVGAEQEQSQMTPQAIAMVPIVAANPIVVANHDEPR